VKSYFATPGGEVKRHMENVNMRKYLLMAILMIANGSALTLKDIVVKYDCKMEDKSCLGEMSIRQSAILMELPLLKFVEKIENSESSSKTYVYNGKECGSSEYGNILKNDVERFVELDDILYTMINCAKYLSIKSILMPEFYVNDSILRFPRLNADIMAKALIKSIICNPFEVIYRSKTQTFNDYVDCKSVSKNFKYSVGGLEKKSLYIIAKKRNPKNELILLDIGETNDFGQMTFYSDSSELKIKPSLKNIRSFGISDAIVIRLTGRLDRSIFDLSYFPNLGTLKGTPVTR
jgi:hypothetical protein